MEEFGVEVKNHMSVIEDEDAALIQELIGENGIPETKKSIVDEYEDQLAEEVNKGVRKKKKTKKEIEREEIASSAGETFTVVGGGLEVQNGPQAILNCKNKNMFR